MYKAFFGLTRNPFEISPDPYFLFATARHNEALASIVHGVLRAVRNRFASAYVGPIYDRVSDGRRRFVRAA